LAAKYVRSIRLLSRDVRRYLVTQALYGFCYMGVFSVLFNLYLLRLGQDAEFVGLVSAVASVAYAVACLPAGPIVSRWGPRKSMIAGLLISGAGFSLVPLVGSVPRPLGAVGVNVVYALSWAGAALYMVAGDPYVRGATNAEERSHAFALQSAAWPLFGFVGSIVGGVLPGIHVSLVGSSLADPGPYGMPLLIAGLAVVAGGVLLVSISEVEPADVESAVSARDGHVPLWPILAMSLVQLLRMGGIAAVATFFTVYLDQELTMGPAAIGVITSLGKIISVPAALLMPLMAIRWGKGGTFASMTAASAISVALMVLGADPVIAAVSFATFRMMTTIGLAAGNNYRVELVGDRWQGAMSGAANMGMGVGSFAISLIGGRIAVRQGYRPTFLIGAAMLLASAVLFVAFERTHKRRDTSGKAAGQLGG
jgi:MFS family permease